MRLLLFVQKAVFPTVIQAHLRESAGSDAGYHNKATIVI
jgi:hypothetical protein